jgi:hypothetical protein
VLSAFLVQLIVIAAVANQWSAERWQRVSLRHDGLVRALAQTPLVYDWRFTARDNDTIRQYPAMLLGLLTFFVVAAVLTFALVRGAITFGRAFVAVLLSTIVATLADGMVQRAVLKDFGQSRVYGSRAAAVLFSGGGFESVAGAQLGLVAGLVAALVAVLTRRAVAARSGAATFPAEPYAGNAGRDPEAPPPFFGEDRTLRPRAAEPQSVGIQKLQTAVGAPQHPDVRPGADVAHPSSDDETTRTWTLPAVDPDAGPDGPAGPAPDPGGPATQAMDSIPSGAPESGDATTRLPRREADAPPGSASSAAETGPPDDARARPTTSFPRPPEHEDDHDHEDYDRPRGQ